MMNFHKKSVDSVSHGSIVAHFFLLYAQKVCNCAYNAYSHDNSYHDAYDHNGAPSTASTPVIRGGQSAIIFL